MKKSLVIYHLYPELLNLYGDKGNVSVLKMRCEKRGIDAVIKTLQTGDKPDFSDADIVVFGGGGESEIKMVREQADVLEQPLKDYVESGGVMLALCEGFSLLGELSILDIETTYTEERFVGDTAIEAELDGKTVTLVGFENHTSRVNVKNHTPLGKVIFGDGNDGVCEGVIYKNTVATHLFGPILPKNPELADCLIKKALCKKYGDNDELCELDDSIEMLAKTHIIQNCKR